MKFQKIIATKPWVTFFMLLVASLFAFPFLWMFMATFKSNLEIFTPFPLFPEKFHMGYYRELFSGNWIPYLRQYINSLAIATFQTLGAVALTATCGYVFGMYQFRFKKILFATAILVILIPRQVMVLPLFIWMNSLHLLDTSFAVILPGVVSGIGVLYFTQIYRNFPGELLDMARTEGATEYKLFFISLPVILPHLLTYGLIHFILAWQEHLIPMVMLSTKENQTVSVALSALYGGSLRIPYALLMVGSLFTVLPTALLYFFTRKQFSSTLKELGSN